MRTALLQISEINKAKQSRDVRAPRKEPFNSPVQFEFLVMTTHARGFKTKQSNLTPLKQNLTVKMLPSKASKLKLLSL